MYGSINLGKKYRAAGFDLSNSASHFSGLYIFNPLKDIMIACSWGDYELTDVKPLVEIFS